MSGFVKRSAASFEMNGHSSPTSNGHSNGHSNGTNGTTKDAAPSSPSSFSDSNWDKGIWAVGVINMKNKRYLTAETFGHKINANGVSLKKKQTWRLEPASGHEHGIYLKSHLDRYLAVDQYGNVTCDKEEKEHGAVFEIMADKDGWSLRNVSRGYFLGAEADKLICSAKAPSTPGERWTVHLAARPQVTLKSVGRKRFAHLAENLEEIYVDANVPWGPDTLFTLEFRAELAYALHTCNNKYLKFDGKLQDTCDPTCLFTIEYHHGQMALRDRVQGLYLAPIGSKAILKTRSHTVTKDELFVLEDSLPQGSFVAKLNGRYVSTKQGVDVTANQDEISDTETFQLEYEHKTKQWYIRTMQDKYWSVESTGGVQAGLERKSSSSLFTLSWCKSGNMTFQAHNGKYVGAKRNGHLYATCEAEDDAAQFWFYLINRPILVLKCEQGYVGYKTNGPFRLECNKASYETIRVERGTNGVVHFKAQNGKYWAVAGDEISVEAETPTDFYIELKEPNRICIKNEKGQYLNAEKNGMFKVGETNEPTLWEF